MIAIYARQSVERPDSISIAMQVEHCRRICPRSVPQQVYTDRGFSGTNTRRPALQQMLEAVEQGQIESVYVYKLDRISRSLCDFAAMMQEFRRRGVTLHSVRESFDTQTEIGGMLLNLLMMFAELEQKTIAGRVRDNYYARAVQQLALGGVPPYGYTAKPVTHGGHPTTMLEVQPEEAQQVQAFYTGYGVAGQNVEQLVQAANQAGSRTRQGASWSNSAVLRLLRSPVYVQGSVLCSIFAAAGGSADTCVGGVLLRKRLSGLRQPQPAAGFQAGASGGRACRRRTAPGHHRRHALAERTGTAECPRRQHQPRHRTHLVATGAGSLRAVRHTLLCPQQRQRGSLHLFCLPRQTAGHLHRHCRTADGNGGTGSGSGAGGTGGGSAALCTGGRTGTLCRGGGSGKAGTANAAAGG